MKRTQARRAVQLLTVVLLAAGNAAGALAAEQYTRVPESLIYCTTCHGVELRGNLQVDAPRLNGLADWYVRNQMLAFRNGWRGTHPEDLIGMEMRPQATTLSMAELEDAVAFVAAVSRNRANHPAQDIAATVTGDTARGANLYATCAACHGKAGEGNAALNAPGLAGQSDWYLLRQLAKFRSGARGSIEGDVLGAQMRAAMAPLADAAAPSDVVAYINTLR